MSAEDRGRKEQLREEAVAWFVRVSSDAATEADLQAFTDWLEASATHVAAYDEIEAVGLMVENNAAAIRAAVQAPRDNVRRVHPSRSTPRRFTLAPVLAVAACLVAAILLVPVVIAQWRDAPETLATGAGQMRTVTLADGTVVRLDAKSKLVVRLGARERRVTMDDAEAAFDVAKDANRPFVIDVGDQRIRVVGTQFNVQHYDGALSVTVRRGVVEVFQPDLGATPVAKLVRGQALEHRDGSALSKVSTVDPDSAFGWTQGRLVSDGRPLSELVAYLNRKYPVPIRLSARAQTMRFYGVLVLDPDESVTARRLAGYLSLTVERSGREILLR